MRGSSAIALSIGIGALIGGLVMGVPAIRNRIVPAQTATTPTTTDQATAPTTSGTPPADMGDMADITPEPALQPADPAPAATPTAAPAATAQAPATAPAAAPTGPAMANFDVKAALQDRVLGKEEAPVLFIDYSSLSCPHCADFHTKTLVQLRRDYIDTGKAKMIFRPFPLNEPALLGEKIARCVPADQYFKILDLLFASQDRWVFADDVKAALRQMVKVAGVTDALFDACLANEELEKGIMQIASDGVARHNLKGTPSFVFGSDMPNAEVVSGELAYPLFAAKLDALANGTYKLPDAAPAATPAMSTP